jgi:hypothetical protein
MTMPQYLAAMTTHRATRLPPLDVFRGALRALLEISPQALSLTEQPSQSSLLVTRDHLRGLRTRATQQPFRLALKPLHVAL